MVDAVRRHLSGAHGRHRPRWERSRGGSGRRTTRSGRRPEERVVGGSDPEQWGAADGAAVRRRAGAVRSPATRTPTAGTPRTSCAGRVRGAAVQLARMNAEIDVRHVLPSIHVPALVLYREGEYSPRSRALHGRADPRRPRRLAPGSGPPALGRRPGGRPAARSEAFVEELDDGARADRVLATVLVIEADGTEEACDRDPCRRRPLPGHGARAHGATRWSPCSTAPRARSAARRRC